MTSSASVIKCALFAAVSSYAVAIQRSRSSRTMDWLGSGAPYKSVLHNSGDTIYYSPITLGNQSMMGIIDTGSFELVVFAADCHTCGTAAKYDHLLSSTYQPGDWATTHNYGSGSCSSVGATDALSVGPPSVQLSANDQFFWQAESCYMPLLSNAPFNAIVGVGPPGEPEYAAQQTLRNYLSEPNPEPATIQSLRSQLQFTRHTNELLQNFNTTRFSECLGTEPGSPGVFVWNDIDRKGQPGVVTVPVSGNITWGVSVSEMSLASSQSDSEPFALGCSPSCGAIVDTGTTLLSLPTAEYNALYNKVASMNVGCGDMSVFPDLVMKMGGQEVRLPPESYVSAVVGSASSFVRKMLHLDDRPSPFMQTSSLGSSGSTDVQCTLMIMDGGTLQTQLGPQMIIGMSMFRQYYSTFDLGTGPSDRTISFMPHDAHCNPSLGLSATITTLGPRAPHVIDASKIQVKQFPTGGHALRIRQI